MNEADDANSDSEVDEKALVANNELILPWKKLKLEIKNNLPKQLLSQQIPEIRSADKKDASIVTQSLSLPHGFQLVKSIGHSGPEIQNVLYWPNSSADTFSCFDTHNAHVYRGNYRLLTTSIQIKANSDKQSALAGLVAWIYVPKWRNLVITNTQLECKILDTNFVCLYTRPLEKPAICLEFVDASDELIIGGVCSISIHPSRKQAEKGRFVQTLLPPRLVINDFESEEWISKTLHCKNLNRLLAVCDNNIYVYDYQAGLRIFSIMGAHLQSITCISYIPGNEYIVTSSKDGTVKVWNGSGFLVAQLSFHTDSVTSICQPNLGISNASSTMLISASLDGFICLWNIETASIISKFETSTRIAWLGLSFMRTDVFYVYSTDAIQVYSIARAWRVFANVRSNAIQISRNGPRLITLCSDGSLRILSPLSGSVLCLGMPILDMIDPVCSIYFHKMSEFLYPTQTKFGSC